MDVEYLISQHDMDPLGQRFVPIDCGIAQGLTAGIVPDLSLPVHYCGCHFARYHFIDLHVLDSDARDTQAYSVGEGPCAFIISSEVFPLFNREVGMSFAVRNPSRTTWKPHH